MRALKILLRIIAVLLLVVLLAGAGLYGFLRLDGGKAFLAQTASKFASTADSQLQLGHITGDIFSDMAIDQISLADRTGMWLQIEKLHLVWQPLKAATGQQVIQQLTANRIVVMRLPVSEEKSKATKSEFSFKTILPWLPQNLKIASIELAKTITGTLTQLQLQASGVPMNYAVNLHTLNGLPTTLAAKFKWQNKLPNIDFKLTEVAGGTLGQLLKLPAAASVQASIYLSPDTAGNVQLRDTAIQAGNLQLTATGDYTAATQTVNGQLQLNVPDLSQWQNLASTDLQGELAGTINIAGPLNALQLQADIKSDKILAGNTAINQLQLKTADEINAAAWNSANFTVNGDLNIAALVNGKAAAMNTNITAHGTQLQLTDIEASYASYAAKGTADFNWQNQNFKIELANTPLPLQTLLPTSNLTGTATAKLTAKGSLQNFTLAAEAKTDTPHGQTLLNFTSDYTGEPERFTGQLTGDLHYDKDAFKLSTTLTADPQNVQINDARLTGPGLDFNGQAAWNIAAQLADADFRLDARNLQPLGRMLGQNLFGTAQANITLSPQNNQQAINLTANAKAVTLNDLHITQLVLTATGNLQNGIAAQLDTAGKNSGQNFKLALAALADQAADKTLTRLQLKKLQGSYADRPIALRRAGEIRWQANKTEITPMQLAIADGTINLQGSITPQNAKMELAARNVKLEKLPGADLPAGSANATLNITGSAARPIAKWSGDAKLNMGDYPLALKLTGDWQQGHLKTTLHGTAQKATLNADADLPATFSLAPLQTNLSPQTAVKAKLNLNAALDMFNAHLRGLGHRVAGQVTGNAQIAGTLGAPTINGRFTLADGSYDHTATGVCLRNTQAVVTATGSQIALQKLSAQNPNGGALSGHATIGLAGAQTLNGNLNFQNFQLFCGTLANGNLDGNLRATGQLQNAMLAGQLKLGPLRAQIPGAKNETQIPEVKTVWMRPGKKAATAQIASDPIKLDIKITAPNSIFVRGRGLDAEFAGNLNISGSASAPVLDGSFNSRRGKFTLLDRTLQLQKASIMFEGPVPPSPFLDVTAQTSAQGTDIQIGLKGSAVKPDITLTATPTRPQDEALALLLFGRELKSISPFQAVKLAQAARVLAGLDSGGPDILDKLRSSLGLDTLDVGTDDANNLSVSTGKYITDKVFVGVKQGNTNNPQDKAVTTEIELKPSISANTAVDGDGNQALGLEWKRDY